jgi:hypothetical protein
MELDYTPWAMRQHMKLRAAEKLSFSELARIASTTPGHTFEMFGRIYRATPLLIRRAHFGLPRMGGETK